MESRITRTNQDSRAHLPGVQRLLVHADYSHQRLDNFLFRTFFGVPKSRIYRLIRKGEFRVNGKRVKPHHKLVGGDELRIPPLTMTEKYDPGQPSERAIASLKRAVLLQTPDFIAFNKPAGWAVHGGSGVALGFIEAVRQAFPGGSKFELVHRLDRDTSGCLLVARKRSALADLHAMFRNHEVKKKYLCLVAGCWPEQINKVALPIMRFSVGGEPKVKISTAGKPAITKFKRLKVFEGASLLQALPVTGKTHQIRVHTAAQGHAILGDGKYADEATTELLLRSGHPGLALHAQCLSFVLRSESFNVIAPTSPAFTALTNWLAAGELPRVTPKAVLTKASKRVPGHPSGSKSR